MRTFTPWIVLSLAAPALGAPILRWIDDEGTTNYTDSPSKVPSQYKAEVTSGDELALVFEDRPSAHHLGSRGANPVGIDTETSAVDERAAEEHWRALFRQAYDRIDQLQTAIENDENTPYSGWHPGCAFGRSFYGFGGWICQDPWYAEVQQRIREDNAELKHAHEALDDLERLASRDAVPREWRRP